MIAAVLVGWGGIAGTICVVVPAGGSGLRDGASSEFLREAPNDKYFEELG